jgi:hypothetical protein
MAAPPPPVPVAPAAPVVNDPHALGLALGRLGGGARRGAKASAAALGVLLSEGEVVEGLVAGQVYGANALGALTNKRLIVVNDRDFKPDVIEIALDSGTTVQGWQDDRSAALLLQGGGVTAQIERIADRPLAMELAQRIRARAAGQG